MRGSGRYDANRGALFAAQVEATEQKWRNRHNRLCWRCQKDKSVKGGKMVLRPGLCMFICKDCMDAKAKEKK